MLQPLPSARIAYAAAVANLPPTATNYVDLLEKLRLRRQLRAALGNLQVGLIV